MSIDADASADTMAKYGVHGIPTVLTIAKGEPLGISTGAMTRSQLDEMIRKSSFLIP